MRATVLQLALRKQRLQLRSAALRQDFGAAAATLAPLAGAIDRLRDAAHWLRRHPEVVAGTAIALAVARPKALFRWIRRGLFAWQTLRRIGGWVGIAR